MPETPEWRKAFRDMASIALGIFIVVYEEVVAAEPRQVAMYTAIVFIVGPAALRAFGK